MTRAQTAQFRTVAFGDPERGTWGAALQAAGQAAVVFGAPVRSGATAASTGSRTESASSTAGIQAVRWSAQDSGWALCGEGFELFVTPQPDPAPSSDPAPGSDPDPVPGGANADSGAGAPGPGDDSALTCDQRCRVSGTLSTGGSEQEVDCLGTQSFSDVIDVSRLGSVRGVSAWFGSAAALSALAFRPRSISGHQDDVVVATLFDPGQRLTAADARISTTYDGAGTPLRTGLELWIAQGDEQFPRRAAGEASGPGAEAVGPAIRLQVTPLRCHARGLEGAGVYLLARL